MLGILASPAIADLLHGETLAEEHVLDTPFGVPSSHVRVVLLGGARVAVLARQGEGAELPPSRVPARANVYALKQIGVTHLVVADEVRSLREELRLGDLLVADQVVDRTTRRSTTFFDDGVCVQVELGRPTCDLLRARLLAGAQGALRSVHPRGTYVCVEGPSWSTAAEAEIHRRLGADVVGQAALPEVRLAREAEMCCALVACVVGEYRAGRGAGEPEVAADAGTYAELARATLAILRATAVDLAAHPAAPCSCHRALDGAVATRPSALRAEVRARYGPLLARFLGARGAG